MDNIVLYISMLCSITNIVSQQNLILNDNMYLVINGGQVVVENSSPDAIRVYGSGGNIISENENNILNWKIGENTGIYKVPFATNNFIKIPLEINIQEGGAGGEGIAFSTYATGLDNIPYPNNTSELLNCFNQDNSKAVLNRFWVLSVEGYTNNPKAILSISYDELYEFGETTEESSLKAMYYNEDIQMWEDSSFFLGNVDEVNNVVENIAIQPSLFYKNWMLVDSTSLFSDLCTDRLIIPEAFTPNGDNINETFQILGLYHYDNNAISIFNRWGSEVYSSQSYDGLWGGTNNSGNLLPAGVYFYVLTLYRGHQEEIKKGTVFIQY